MSWPLTRPNVFVNINSCVKYSYHLHTHTRFSVWHQLHAAPQHASTVEALGSNDNVQCVAVAVAVANCTHSYSRFIARFVLMWTGLNWTGVCRVRSTKLCRTECSHHMPFALFAAYRNISQVLYIRVRVCRVLFTDTHYKYSNHCEPNTESIAVGFAPNRQEERPERLSRVGAGVHGRSVSLPPLSIGSAHTIDSNRIESLPFDFRECWEWSALRVWVLHCAVPILRSVLLLPLPAAKSVEQNWTFGAVNVRLTDWALQWSSTD